MITNNVKYNEPWCVKRTLHECRIIEEQIQKAGIIFLRW